MNRAQRWLLVGGILFVGRAVFAPPAPPDPHAPWVAAIAAALGLLALWAGTRRHGLPARTERERVGFRWWLLTLMLSLVLSVATLVTGLVPPRWVGCVTVFPFFATFFVNAGGMAPVESERYGNVMRVLLLSGLALYLVSLALGLPDR